MDEVLKLIESGLLEIYVMGAASEEDAAYVERMAQLHSAVKEEMNAIELALEAYSMEHAIEPDPIIRPFLMATMDYMERLGGGEAPAFPPELNNDSKIADFEEWIGRADMQPYEGWSDVFAKIIGYTPQMTTAIVWIENAAPPETHENQFERFLILEGTCNIQLEGEDNHLVPGDFFTIPLHVNHTVLITSNIACKVIIQRIAA
jgi:mannose-6-phosphate isomerase-like protein (cupin superfamily)